MKIYRSFKSDPRKRSKAVGGEWEQKNLSREINYNLIIIKLKALERKNEYDVIKKKMF